ncbi:MAG: tRNA (N6-isopentenyl adenosine(37)-C2)-methylthiotransferase MiaB [Clostridia bacterium]|nr:tRNA (N6-isopentenyl adenosine(37)-C2)-methylthiotransferase MiaB [Clostridia bacterium]
MVNRVSENEIKRQREIIEKKITENQGKNRTACVITLGCVQNENDSERIRGMLFEMGYSLTENSKTADVVIFNTCAVRENAELKVFGFLGALKHIKEQRHDMLIGICGCMIQQNHIVETIKSKFKFVDMIFGTHSLHRFPQILYSALKQRVIDVEQTDGYIAENLMHIRESKVAASVSVMYGCNNFCSYCIVPYVRGRERSRLHNDIIAEVEGLAAMGYKEITLVGQNVNSYGKDCGEIDFADLLHLVSKIEGIERIRFVSVHPKDITDKLIAEMASNKKICRQLHVPLQSGSTKVLSDMNRKYSKEQYLALIDKIKKAMPDIALSTDIIVGFPTETNEDFADTMDVVQKVGYDMIYNFIYSKRQGTPAAKMDFVLSEDEIKANFNTLIKKQAEILYNKNILLQNKIVEVLVEGKSRTDDKMLTGRTQSNKIVNFSGDEKYIGQIVKVKLNKIATWSLTGEITD